MIITRYSIGNIDKKIAVLADIHNTPLDYELIKKESPDLILIPGDISTDHLTIDGWKREKKEKSKSEYRQHVPQVFVERHLKELPQIAPTFFSIGNHETKWYEEEFEKFSEGGIVVLNDTYITIDNILIAGISSFSRHCEFVEGDFDAGNKLLEEIKKIDKKKIVMLHEPQNYLKYNFDSSIEYVVSGHAHGGQWRVFNRGVFSPGQGLFPKYTKGIYNNQLIVSAGMSNTAGIIPRFFNPEEILIIEKE